MKKIIWFLGIFLVVGSFLVSLPMAKANSLPVVDSEFLPDANYYGESYPPFIRACTRFVPTRSSYSGAFDLAVKNGKGASQPITASLRSSAGAIPGDAVKLYTQTSFNNYADGNKSMSQFVSNDQENVSVTVGAKYWLCIETIDSDVVNSGWFYKANATGYSYRGINADPTTEMAGVSFGYRTYGYNPVTPPPADPGNTGVDTNIGTTPTTTTGSSNVAQGSVPSSNISSAIAKPTGLTAVYSADAKAVVLLWKASTTSTIGGYNIYRSAVSGKDYKKIADTGKTTVTYSNTTIVAGTTYFYMIRAYKDTAESANSDEASAIVPAGAAVTTDNSVATTSSTGVVDNKIEITPLIWALLAFAVVLIGLLIFLVVKRRKVLVPKKV